MTATDWAGLILTLLSIVTIVGIGTRWSKRFDVKQIMEELTPNGGSSIKDQVTRLEDKTDKIFDLMIEHLKDHSK